MSQGLQLTQTLRLTPLITPVLRRSRDQRPRDDEDEDDAPWREPVRDRPGRTRP